MSNSAIRINAQASKIAREYVQILRDGREPAYLASWIERNRYDIMHAVNDGRRSMSKTLAIVMERARQYIKHDLTHVYPDLGERLLTLRKERAERQAKEDHAREFSDARPLPSKKSN